MSSDSELKSLVDPCHLEAALRQKYGPGVSRLRDFVVSRATANVLGITSLVLRVRVNLESGERDSFVVKRLPLCSKQLELVDNCNSFEREIEFLTKYAPMLRQRADDQLLVVDCFFGQDRVLVLEDLCASGFKCPVDTIGDLRFNLFTEEHARAVVRALAKLHAASTGVDWDKNFPHFLPHNPLFDGADGEFFKSTLESAIEGLLYLTDEFLKEIYSEVVTWLQGGDLFHKMRRFGKRSDKMLNVLNHGDPWGNNILFRRNEQTGELELKMVDYQLAKFAPATSDLLYFLYTSTSCEFRSQHERALLKYYVREFNAAVDEDYKLDWPEFEAHCKESRLYGLLFAVLCRPMLHMHKKTPSSEMSDETFMQFMERDYKGHERNKNLRDEICEIFVDLVQYYFIIQMNKN